MNTEQERAEFEAWFQDERGQPARKADGTYSPFASGCWRAWQARAALQSQDREDLLKALIIAEDMLCKQENALRIFGAHEPCAESAILSAREAIDHARRAEEDLK